MEPIFVILSIIGLILILLLAGGGNKLLRFIGQGIIKCVIGALFLFFVNAFGAQIDIHIPINIITTGISGFLGISGILALVAIKYLIL